MSWDPAPGAGRPHASMCVGHMAQKRWGEGRLSAPSLYCCVHTAGFTQAETCGCGWRVGWKVGVQNQPVTTLGHWRSWKDSHTRDYQLAEERQANDKGSHGCTMLGQGKEGKQKGSRGYAVLVILKPASAEATDPLFPTQMRFLARPRGGAQLGSSAHSLQVCGHLIHWDWSDGWAAADPAASGLCDPAASGLCASLFQGSHLPRGAHGPHDNSFIIHLGTSWSQPPLL